ncbi:MAG: OmpA family protein [Betaproteobacteria bacterium]|nr:OmpA family protein [Betaproteobacteria bacterium]
MDDDDGSVKIALGTVGGILALVIALVIGLAIREANLGQEAAADTLTELIQTGDAAPEPVGEALVKIYFDTDQAEMPEAGSKALETVVTAAQERPETIILISGFHDASGNLAHNQALALQRAVTVRKVLIFAGIDPHRLRLSKPANTQGNGDPEEARCVELRIQ